MKFNVETREKGALDLEHEMLKLIFHPLPPGCHDNEDLISGKLEMNHKGRCRSGIQF